MNTFGNYILGTNKRTTTTFGKWLRENEQIISHVMGEFITIEMRRTCVQDRALRMRYVAQHMKKKNLFVDQNTTLMVRMGAISWVRNRFRCIFTYKRIV